ncbi:hypothetical protein [Adhaeribacter soli]|uniref:RHS repeat protein n=1 Tax=Adhaeribacter soli TaxID=2607655 RepID=A0A5N1J4E6_9BACT|nr:hypothetical protein [Adhaeribacter soli]KAA9345560.1 hypothetical protein F0P94_00270 [Adhaeribacter soli]
MHKNLVSAFFFLLALSLVAPAAAQFSSREYRPLQLTRDVVQSNRIKSVMAMMQMNLAETEDDYLPRRESYETYRRHKDSNLRKLLFFTSLGSFTEFDTEGNIVAVASMGQKSYTTYAYNKQNKMIEHKEIDLNYPTSSDSEMEISYKYDDKGNYLGYANGGIDVSLIRNNKGEVTSWNVLETEYQPRDEDEEKEPKKPKTKPKVTNISGQFQFDKQGRLLRRQQHPDYYDETQYSENGRTRTSLSYKNNQLREKIVQVTDAQDHVIKTEHHKPRNGKVELYSTSNATYDENGNLLQYQTTNALEPALSSKVNYKIEKSKSGLPLRRQVFQNDRLLGTEIFYYEHF